MVARQLEKRPHNVDDIQHKTSLGERSNPLTTMKGKPHINIGVIGGNSRPSMILTALGSLSAMAGSLPPGETAFSRLSEAAQDLIVSATLGEFDETGPPEMPPEVRAELAQWAAESEEENAKVVAAPPEPQ